MDDAYRFPNPFPLPGSIGWGDDRYGLWCTVRIEGRAGASQQRFRWIESGTFWMGSPETEAEREENEGPRHLVTLTDAFWLADTACTQELWEAVMGRNPSAYKGDPRCPVEQVSWEDVQRFLHMLKSLLPGCEASLPTEAQWEYACRAGTQTPFSFGEQITPAQVNYHGDFPYNDSPKGEYRERTVPVSSLPANPWGLYEMHGNVWEWCADGMRRYDEKPQCDPVGNAGTGGDARRAVRGGSWHDLARGSRSALRRALRPGEAYRFLGFRLCLRSSEPSPVQDLRGAWVTSWLSVTRQRPHSARLVIPAGHGEVFEAVAVIRYVRGAGESIVREVFDATWREGVLRLRGKLIEFIQQGNSIFYSLDTFELRLAPGSNALVGRGIFKNGERDIEFKRDSSNNAL